MISSGSPAGHAVKIHRNHLTQRRQAATELREAYGVRPACWRYRSANDRPKAGASSTHSIRFATLHAGAFARSLRVQMRIVLSPVYAHPRFCGAADRGGVVVSPARLFSKATKALLVFAP